MMFRENNFINLLNKHQFEKKLRRNRNQESINAQSLFHKLRMKMYEKKESKYYLIS